MTVCTTQSGAIALTTVLVLAAIATAVTVALLSQSLDLGRSVLLHQQSAQARGLANACAEEGLEQIRSNDAFVGTGTVTLGAGTCSYTVTNQGGENRQLTATATVGGVVRKVSVTITQLFPTITISQWSEVADF